MNKEVIKAMERSAKGYPFRKWRLSISRKVGSFLSWLANPYYAVKHWKHDREIERCKWNEKRAKIILDYYVPRRAVWQSKDNSFYFFDNGMGWSLYQAKKYLKRRDRKFWKYNASTSFFGGQMCEYLIEKFELEYFHKEICQVDGGLVEIIFRLEEE